MNIHRAVTELVCMEQIHGLTAAKVLHDAYSVLLCVGVVDNRQIL